MMNISIILLTVICIVCVSGDIPASSQCQPSACGTRVVSCSTNSDCECLALGSGSGGVCASSLLPCSSLTPCSSDNVTCTAPSTVCIISTRCNKPMCYPLALADPRVCPSLNSTTTSTFQTSTVSPNRNQSTSAPNTAAPLTSPVVNMNTSCLVWNQNPIVVAGNGTNGNSTRMLSGPWDFSIDSNSNLYISDGNNNRIIKFASGSLVGIPLTSGLGSGASQVSNPSGSVIDASGSLFVSDMFNNRIMKYANILSASASPPIVGQVVAGGSYGSNYNQQSTSWGVAVDKLGNTYVSDYSNNRVMKWAPGATTGSLVAGIGNGTSGNSSNQLHCPLGIHVDQNMVLYIADACNGRIQKWLPGASAGTTVAGANGQIGYPTDVAVDAYGIIYVLNGDQLYRFYPGSTLGTVVISFYAGSFGFKFDSVGNVYGADYYSGVIKKFTINSTNCGAKVAKTLDVSSKIVSAAVENHRTSVEAVIMKSKANRAV